MIACPARSPDLAPLDYSLWGYMKSVVYKIPVDSEEDLLTRIMAAADMYIYMLKAMNGNY